MRYFRVTYTRRERLAGEHAGRVLPLAALHAAVVVQALAVGAGEVAVSTDYATDAETAKAILGYLVAFTRSFGETYDILVSMLDRAWMGNEIRSLSLALREVWQEMPRGEKRERHRVLKEHFDEVHAKLLDAAGWPTRDAAAPDED